MHKFCYDVELTFCSFLSKFTYSKNLKTGTIHLKKEIENFTCISLIEWYMRMKSFTNFIRSHSSFLHFNETACAATKAEKNVRRLGRRRNKTLCPSLLFASAVRPTISTLGNIFIFYLRNLRYSKVIYFIHHCQNYLGTESGTQR